MNYSKEAMITLYNKKDKECEIDAMESDPSYEASVRLKNVIKLAKKWNNSTTEYNRIQFLAEFNAMNERDQDKAIEKGSELSKVLIGWCAAVRLEIQNLA